MIFEKYLSGVGIAEIARYLNENHPKEGGWWYTSAVRFMLHNEAYKGDTLHQKHYTTDTLPFMVYHNEGQFPKNTVPIKAMWQSFRTRNSRKCRTC